MAFQPTEVLVSSRLFEELKWLEGLVQNSLFYFADYVKSVVRVDYKINDVQKAFLLAPTLTKTDSKELNCQVAVQILLLGNYKGIDKARLLTDNAKNRCRAILFALNTITKTEHNKDNLLWPRLENIRKKLGVFDFEKMPKLGIFQFVNLDYFKICTSNIYPIIEKMTIVDLLKPLDNEILNMVRRTMIFTLNANSLNKAFKKNILGVPYMSYLATEFEKRKLHKIVEKETEIIPTPDGLEFHILGLNKQIKDLKADKKKLIADLYKMHETVPVQQTSEDFSEQVQLFQNEILELKQEKSNLNDQLVKFQENITKSGVVDLAVTVNRLTNQNKDQEQTIQHQKKEIDNLKSKVEECKNLVVVASDEKNSAMKQNDNNSKLSIALQSQLNNQLSKYRDLQQRFEAIVEENSKKDAKILQLNKDSGQLINSVYVQHLDTKLKSLTQELKNRVIDEVTLEFIEDCKISYISTLEILFRFREEADRPNRLKIAQERNTTEKLTLDSVKWSDADISSKVADFMATCKVSELLRKSAGLLAYARVAESYDKLDNTLLAEKLKNEKLNQALVSLKDSEIEKTLEHVLDAFVVKSRSNLSEELRKAEFQMETLKINIDSKVNTVNQILNSALDKLTKLTNEGKEYSQPKHSGGVKKEESSSRQENKKQEREFHQSKTKATRILSSGDKFFWSHRNVILTVTEKFNPSKILPYADLDTSEEMEAQKFYNYALNCGYRSQFNLL